MPAFPLALSVRQTSLLYRGAEVYPLLRGRIQDLPTYYDGAKMNLLVGLEERLETNRNENWASYVNEKILAYWEMNGGGFMGCLDAEAIVERIKIKNLLQNGGFNQLDRFLGCNLSIDYILSLIIKAEAHPDFRHIFSSRIYKILAVYIVENKINFKILMAHIENKISVERKLFPNKKLTYLSTIVSNPPIFLLKFR